MTQEATEVSKEGNIMAEASDGAPSLLAETKD
jgi:hypothetical protein